MVAVYANVPDVFRYENGTYVTVVRKGATDSDILYLHLSETLEFEFSKYLRTDKDVVAIFNGKSVSDQILEWAAFMNQAIPGYGNWDEIYSYAQDLLYAEQEYYDDPEEKSKYPKVGTEADLVKWLSLRQRESYDLLSEKLERERFKNKQIDVIVTIRQRIELLDAYRNGAARVPERIQSLYRKVYYAYKLLDALLNQVGYYNGSLELQAGLSTDFEYHMYMIQMKLRRPDRQQLFKAPKSMAYYRTDPESLLPWNNQFSFSYGYNEFGVDQIPSLLMSYFDRNLVHSLRSSGIKKEIANSDLKVDLKKISDLKVDLGRVQNNWSTLCKLMEWDEHNDILQQDLEQINKDNVLSAEEAEGNFIPRPFNLSRRTRLVNSMYIIEKLKKLNDDDRSIKAYFTLILGLTWSDSSLIGTNPFSELMNHGTNAERVAATMRIAASDIKDPRISWQSGPPTAILSAAKQFYNVAGKNANVVLDPKSVLPDFHKKLSNLTEAELKQLYSNIKLKSGEKLGVEVIMNQARDAAEKWIDQAISNRRPIYTGPSGHMLSYARIYRDSFEKLSSTEKSKSHYPNLERMRLVILAALTGFNQHHSYDEVMTASHGFTSEEHSLNYIDRIGYRDIIESTDPMIAHVGKQLVVKARSIVVNVLNEYEKVENKDLYTIDPKAFVKEWFHAVTGQTY